MTQLSPEALNAAKQRLVTLQSRNERSGGGLVEAARPLSRTVKNAAAGLISIPEIASRPLGELMDLASKQLGVDTNFGASPSQAVRDVFDRNLDTAPRDTLEAVADTASEAVASGGPLKAVAQVVPKAAALAPKSVRELLGFAGAGAGAEIANRAGVSPVVGSLVGGLVTQFSPSGILRKNVDQQAVSDLVAAGIKPTIATTGARTARTATNVLKEVPGSGSIIEKSAKKTIDDINQSVVSVAEGLSPAKTATEAGTIVQKGAKDFVSRFQQRSSELFNKVDDFVRPSDKVGVSNTIKFLEDRAAELSEAPNLQGVLENPALRAVSKAFVEDASDGQLTYQVLKNLRSNIGRKLSNPSIIDDIPRAELKRLYGVLSEDMKAAALSKGDVALSAFNRANDFYKSGLNRIEGSLNKVINSDTPERAFQLATQGTKLGATKLAALKKSLNRPEFNALQGVVIRNMGLARPFAQDATGEAFSINTFMTNWNSLSPEAKNVLFTGVLGKQMDKLARAGNTIKDTERLANPSGTARQLITGGTGAALVLSPVTTIASLGGANVAARLMTSPKFVTWLANAPKNLDDRSLSKYLGKLSLVAASDPNIADDVNEYLEVVAEDKTLDAAVLDAARKRLEQLRRDQ